MTGPLLAQHLVYCEINVRTAEANKRLLELLTVQEGDPIIAAPLG